MRYRFIQAEKAHYPWGSCVSSSLWPGVAFMRGADARRALARDRISG